MRLDVRESRNERELMRTNGKKSLLLSRAMRNRQHMRKFAYVCVSMQRDKATEKKQNRQYWQKERDGNIPFLIFLSSVIVLSCYCEVVGVEY